MRRKRRPGASTNRCGGIWPSATKTKTPRRGGAFETGLPCDQCFLVLVVSVFDVLDVDVVPVAAGGAPVDEVEVVLVIVLPVPVVSVDIVPVVPVMAVSGVAMVGVVVLLALDEVSVATAPVSVTLLLFVSLLQA